MNDRLRAQLPVSVAWLVAYAVVWSVFTAISVYVLTAEAGPQHLEHVVVVAGFIMLALGSRALVGVHAARAAAFAFAPIVLFAFGASRKAQDALLFGLGDWCGTGRYRAAMEAALMSLPMGLLAVGLFVFFQLRRAPAPRLVRPRLPLGAVALLGVLLTGVVVSSVRSASRLSIADVKGSLMEMELVPVPASSGRVANESGYPLALSCGEDPGLRSRAKAGPDVRADEGLVDRTALRCAVVLDESASASGTRLYSMSSESVQHGDHVAIAQSSDGRITTFRVRRKDGRMSAPFGVSLDGVPVQAVHVRDLAPRLGPSWVVPVVAGLGGLPLALLGLWLARARRRLATVLRGREGQLDEAGRVELGGEALLADPSLSGVRPGPVVVLESVSARDYRAAGSVTALALGTKLDAFEHHAEVRREWTPVAVVAAMILAAPILAAASLGLI